MIRGRVQEEDEPLEDQARGGDTPGRLRVFNITRLVSIDNL